MEVPLAGRELTGVWTMGKGRFAGVDAEILYGDPIPSAYCFTF